MNKEATIRCERRIPEWKRLLILTTFFVFSTSLASCDSIINAASGSTCNRLSEISFSQSEGYTILQAAQSALDEASTITPEPDEEIWVVIDCSKRLLDQRKPGDPSDHSDIFSYVLDPDLDKDLTEFFTKTDIEDCQLAKLTTLSCSPIK